ncbi:MAG: hypothetical protein ACI9BD_000899, partial [Candidatus Marinamargulisbacteria bacterium]
VSCLPPIFELPLFYHFGAFVVFAPEPPKGVDLHFGKK